MMFKPDQNRAPEVNVNALSDKATTGISVCLVDCFMMNLKSYYILPETIISWK